ncbi:MAG: hypothetical protein KBS96_05540 [Lachnospiraceae bacterium]|nr:hypothetical protein [Candidatus Colinaster scatohippi]
MSIQMKLLPTLIMLLAGAFTSVITWLLGYDSKTAMWILVGVLVLFYIIGVIVQKVIWKFEVQIAEEEAKRAEEEAEEEGKVVEKDGAAADSKDSRRTKEKEEKEEEAEE